MSLHPFRRAAADIGSAAARGVRALELRSHQRIQAADAHKKGPLYEARGMIVYDNATRTATVRSRPSLPCGYGACPWGESTADGTVMAAHGKLCF
ncbi:hypothetical protein [Streptomyces sp. NPDC007905]|uniref:hypothetical protein n=1 Tax=Streptomyces sp. NPDC007905 TaxID=3364788 RepID=UPI0036EBD2E6